MATTPRYVATTVADAVTYVRNALDPDVWVQVFDADRDGTVASASADETEFVRALCRAETRVDEALGASHGFPKAADAFAALPAGAQDSIRECVLELLPWERVKFRPSMKDEAKAPYRVLWKDAKERLTKLADDNKARLPGAGAPAPTPLAGVVDLSDDTTNDGLVWTRNATSGSGGY
jgi:hypothetical protein